VHNGGYMLNPDSPMPLYSQLADFLVSEIRSGKLAPGERLASETALAGQFGIGRPTVRQALDLLLRRGLIEKRKGAGTFVRKQSAEIDLFSLSGTSAAFHTAGIDVRMEITDGPRFVVPATADDNPLSGRRCVYFRRRSLADGAPLLLEDFYLDALLFPGIEHADFAGESISALIRGEYHGAPSGGKQVFRIAFADETTASLLGLAEGSPLLQVRRTIDLKHREAALYTEMLCRTDRFAFSQKLQWA
ncbi:MAG TPA: GntR family transcriptional regulator, partial [Desulfuromonadaceae bacterium]